MSVTPMARSLRRRYSLTAFCLTTFIVFLGFLRYNLNLEDAKALWAYDHASNTPSSVLLNSDPTPAIVVSSVVELAWTTVVETTTIATTVVTTSTPTPTLRYDPQCETVRKLKEAGVMIVMKTGAQEVFSGLPIHLSTTLRCFEGDDVLMFSDLDQSMGQFTIHDVLKLVEAPIRNEHADFGIYRKLQQYKNANMDVSSLKEDNTKGSVRDGWRLDKYKFLHIIEETYQRKPGYMWYVFMETDSYYIWDNLLAWLSTLDASQPSFYGSAVMISTDIFAHGGSGYILSGAALQLYAEKKTGEATAFDPKMEYYCCGDQVLGRKLKELGVGITNAWPMMQGEKPYTIPYGPNQWCQPVITMHHMLPDEISQVWRYEQARKGRSLMLYRDLYTHFMASKLTSRMVDWHNLSNDRRYGGPTKENIQEWFGLTDVEKKAHESVDSCEAACRADEDCMQWMFDGGCSFSSHWKMGRYRDPQDNGDAGRTIWHSGWIVDRINHWVESHQCDDGPKWVNVDDSASLEVEV